MTDDELVEWCAYQARTLRRVGEVVREHQLEMPQHVKDALFAALLGPESGTDA